MEHPTRVGKYEIEQHLGGSMSLVYRARDMVLGRRVAIKMLSEASDSDAKARFLHEARVASNLSHENVIAVHDFGEENGSPYMVMEYLAGESLRDALREKRPPDFTSRMQIALQVARALEYIHSKKIIHRDIKPENVNIDPLGRAKLMDFGIAKAENVNLTKTGLTVGTPFYMSPEQVMGKAVSVQTDVYAFGLLLYELLTGQKAVRGKNFEEVFEQVLNQPVPNDALHESNVSPLLIDLIARCTAKDPNERPKGLSAISGQLESILEPGQRNHKRSTDMAAVTAPATMPKEPEEDLPALLRALPGPMKTPAGLMTLSAAAVLVVTLAVLKLARVI
jgi:serine/threonine-protein kinase